MDEKIPSNGEGENKDIPQDGMVSTKLTGMYETWFLDYASYVILERAVPHLHDGLKPVQRRILHSMRRMEDGRYNKVANIIGNTMQFHPHGDASIGEALVGMGQKDLLVDTQGNWGNQLTGDSAAAPRYIEARLSKFALDVVFNPKITEWKLSYDGRNEEPITLPVKFPLLLAQGVEGIAVGLAAKILPHNFNELIDASIDYLKGKSFTLYPDFPTGGLIDVSRYNNGLRGGAVRIRSKITKEEDNRTLRITDIPYGRTTESVIDSILRANEKGKIKVKKIDDNTAEHVEILVHLAANTSPDKTIDALYAFTDCEISISPNCTVIDKDRPKFLGVEELLKVSADHSVDLLKRELQIKLNELEEAWHMSSLEKIFIENRLYLLIEDCETWEAIIETIDKGLEPYKKLLKRKITEEDITKLTEIKIKRISKYDTKKADEHIKGLEAEIEKTKDNLNKIVEYTINFYKTIKKKYGKGRERKSEIRSFENIDAAKVVVANEKLYVNRSEGFVGTALKKEEYVCDCSDIDDIIVFLRDGRYIVTKVANKAFIGKDIIHVAVWKKNDSRTIYNTVYRDGKSGRAMIKRFAVKSVTRDREYNLTKGTPYSRVLYFTENPNGEAEVIKVYLKPKPRIKKLIFETDFSEIAIKGRQSQGNILTRHDVHKIVMKEKGTSTLGGRKIWFDKTILRLNTDGNGDYLGEFKGDDKIVVFYKSGLFATTNYDLTNHYEEDILRIEKMNDDVVYTCVHYDGEQKYYYIKRFKAEDTGGKLMPIIGEHKNSRLITISPWQYPQFEIEFGGKHARRDNELIDASEFIAIKGAKARGKRLTSYEVKKVTETEPVKPDDPLENADENDDIDNSDDNEDDGIQQMSINIE
ncbi:DNA gyrase subunit A [Salinivirga cyanobacteriivorans]|uniref:DNA gyrase subunit A n=1 Tax=Salinivirga cyanobacteriivorans TaxID=1307839 RepID=A0A0S2I1R6_9BACT|nr:DNA gyrase/topoisomerase IV subunit A [Salinivirga cyanobacteriivorans]ALO16218.1 DNA gyrase subunit A [Salinivirga cyanobacteriivorans]